MRGLATAALALAVLLGCGEREAERAETPAAVPAPAVDPGDARELQGVRIRRQPDGRLRVRAHRAPRGDVLRELARAAGFAIDGTAPAGSVDLELESASAEDVLAAVLDAVAYDLAYAPARGEAELVRVTLGPRRARPPAPAREAAPARKLPTEEAEADPQSRAEAARALASRDDDGERLEGEPRELMASLASAADPGTRAAAARALGDLEGGEDAFLAAQALLRSLSDRDPQVLVASITALEGLHDLIPDPRHLEAVRRLRDHADPRVRSAAEAFLAWTDDER